MSATLHRLFILSTRYQVDMLASCVRQNWKAMLDAGKPLAVVVSEHKAKRSTAANNAYLGDAASNRR